MPGTYSKVTTVNSGDTILASTRNSEHDNHISNCDFSGLGDYSATAAEMRSTADPYPGSVESQATDGKGELERLRYVIGQITGKTYWYQDPDVVLGPSDITVSTAGYGLVVKTPDGTHTYRIGISNNGEISSELVS